MLEDADDQRLLLDNGTREMLFKRLACSDPASELAAASFFKTAWQSPSPPRDLTVDGVARPADQVFFMAQCRFVVRKCRRAALLQWRTVADKRFRQGLRLSPAASKK
ncbi:hypothetical protein MRX96_021548 [Rhipicephalus microplus]